MLIDTSAEALIPREGVGVRYGPKAEASCSSHLSLRGWLAEVLPKSVGQRSTAYTHATLARPAW